jgi:hypothetical protein
VFWLSCSSCLSSHLLREEFLLAPIHSPSLVASLVFDLVSEPIRVFRDSNQSKVQRWCTRNEDRVLRTSMKRTTRCGRDGRLRCFSGKGQILWDITLNTTYVHPIKFLAPRLKDIHDANNKAVDYLFRAPCQSEFDQVKTEDLACRI